MHKQKREKKQKYSILRNHQGDVYIQMLICTTIMLLASVVMFSVASAINSKMWLDEKLDDIAKNISVSGTIDSTTIHTLENEITDRYGGKIIYTLVHDADEVESQRIAHEDLFVDEHKVQLNDKVVITYTSDRYIAISLAEIKIETPVSIQKTAISQVYYKQSSEGGLVDP